MSTRASAYAALGLEPGADAAAIDRAYKRLIKQYHPDRAGGDAKRAAEINRAYRELRAGQKDEREALDLYPYGEEIARQRQVRAAFGVAVAVLVLAFAAVPFTGLFEGQSPAFQASGSRANPPRAAPAGQTMDQPLATRAMDEAIRDALRISGSEDEVALAAASRDCHRRLRAELELALLDRCAAFDDTVIQLQDRDPLRDRGPFSELAVTGRQMSAATLFSHDYLAIDSRLKRVRLYVELALVPPAPPSPATASEEAVEG